MKSLQTVEVVGDVQQYSADNDFGGRSARQVPAEIKLLISLENLVFQFPDG